MEVSSHSLFLLQQLNVQREFGFLCDCTVAIGNVYFKAHRAVLAAFSNYFKMIFIHQSRSAGMVLVCVCGGGDGKEETSQIITDVVLINYVVKI